MTSVRPLFDTPRAAALLLGAIGVVLLVTIVTPLALLPATASLPPSGSPFPSGGSSAVGELFPGAGATSIGELGSVPTEVEAGVPTVVAWQALDAEGLRVPSFAAPGELTITESANGSSASAWVNASGLGALVRSANGTFSIPSTAWHDGVLNVSLDLGVAEPVTVRLFGPLLPALPGPIALTVLPDLDHLVLYAPEEVQNDLGNASRSYVAFYHVHDRFGNPAPGATLLVEFATGSSVERTFVPVVWSTDGTTGAWVNCTAPGSGGGTFTVFDAAGATLLGPFTVPAAATGSVSSAPSLSLVALVGVTVLAVGGLGGVGALVSGGRPRASRVPSREEEELRRLAEGRATVVELLRRTGPLALHEIEARWEPPPAPPALADWVASLVTDGTLTATLGDGGRARFALAERPVAEPRVTLDEDALEREIARRDAAVARDDEEADEPAP